MNQRHLWQGEGKRQKGWGWEQCDRENFQCCQVGAGTQGQEKIRLFSCILNIPIVQKGKKLASDM